MTTDKSKTKKPSAKQNSPKHNRNHHDHNHDHNHDHSHDDKLIIDNTSIELEILWKEVEPVFKKVLRQVASKLKLDGFRQGKVPISIAEQKVDPEAIIERVLEQISPKKVQEFFEKNENKYKLISRPEVSPIETEKGKPWKIKVSFAEKPTISLKGYEAIVKKAKKLAKDEIEKNQKDKRAKTKEQNNHDEEKNKEITIQIIFRELIKELKPQIPELLVRQEVQYRLENVAESLQRIKSNIQEYLESRKIHPQEFLAQIQAEALAALQLEFLLAQITVEKKIEASQELIDAEIEKISKKNKEIAKLYKENPQYLAQLRQNILRQKTVESLLS